MSAPAPDLPLVYRKFLIPQDRPGEGEGGYPGCTSPGCPLPRLIGKQHCYFHFAHLFGARRRRIRRPRRPLPLTTRKRLARALTLCARAVARNILTYREAGQLIYALQQVSLRLPRA